jgi:putative ABC transport system permease protein
VTAVVELRRAARRLAAARWPTLAAVLSLALGLGAGTTVFSAVDAVVLRPFAFENQDQLVLIGTAEPSPRGELSYPDIEDWQRRSTTLTSLAAIGSLNWSLSLTGSGEPVTVGIRAVGGRFFSTLGDRPALGRTIGPADDLLTASRVIVLADGFWRRQFGGDPTVVGRTIVLDRTPVEVVGVMPPGFRFPVEVDAWVPLVPALADAGRNSHVDLLHARQVRFLFAVGRLAPGATATTAAADLSAQLSLADAAFGQAPTRRGLVTR